MPLSLSATVFVTEASLQSWSKRSRERKREREKERETEKEREGEREGEGERDGEKEGERDRQEGTEAERRGEQMARIISLGPELLLVLEDDNSTGRVSTNSGLVPIRHLSLPNKMVRCLRSTRQRAADIKRRLTDGSYLTMVDEDGWTPNEMSLLVKLAVVLGNAAALGELLTCSGTPAVNEQLVLCTQHPTSSECNAMLADATFRDSEDVLQVLLHEANIIFQARDLAFSLYSLISKLAEEASRSSAVHAVLAAGADPTLQICPKCANDLGDGSSCMDLVTQWKFEDLNALFVSEKRNRTLVRRCAQVVRSRVSPHNLSRLPLPPRVARAIRYLDY